MNLLEHPEGRELGSLGSATAGLAVGLVGGLDVLGAVPPTFGNIAGVDREADFPGTLVGECGALGGRRHALVIVPRPKDEADTGAGGQLDKTAIVSQQKKQAGSTVPMMEPG